MDKEGIQNAPKARQKVPIEPGFTLRDWYRIMSGPGFQAERVHSLAQTSRSNKSIPFSEVMKHKTKEDCWTVLRGKVYDVTAYVRFHPGGADKLMMGAGKDSTSLFDKYHKWVNYETLLEKCFLGPVANDLQSMMHMKKGPPPEEVVANPEQPIN
ncbi:cytochrome b5 domain-containing protein RLF [Acrasis kona]|uniref:Cytochrome b5 domain-containing protein RLF n=1 Tax=Acrasis kona TaxID=1008807 RepID=A0AAW2ZLH4_9EUKA